jgi:hypothetical protein
MPASGPIVMVGGGVEEARVWGGAPHKMTLDDWLVDAKTDADRRDLPELKPLLDTLADATRALRAASWNSHAAGPPATVEAPDQATRPGDAR